MIVTDLMNQEVCCNIEQYRISLILGANTPKSHLGAHINGTALDPHHVPTRWVENGHMTMYFKLDKMTTSLMYALWVFQKAQFPTNNKQQIINNKYSKHHL